MYITFIILAMALLYYFKYMPKGKRAYNSYYKEKTGKFPWLENYIKENRINPAKMRFNENPDFAIAGRIILLLAIYFIGGWILNVGIRFIVFAMAGTSIMNEVEYAVTMYAGSAIAFIAVLITGKIKFEEPPIAPDRVSGEVSYDDCNLSPFNLECLSCHCPHSWVMTRFKIIVESGSSTTVTTKTTRTESADAYGGGFIGAGAAALGRRSSSSSRTFVTVTGKSIKDFKCLNCGDIVLNKTDSHTWDSYVSDCEYNFNPPKEAWKISSALDGKTRFSNTVLTPIIIVIAVICSLNIAKDLTRGKIEATQIHAAEIDPELNGTLSGRYLGLSIIDKPKRGSDEIYRIRAGEFFTIPGEREGRYVAVVHNGKKGYVFHEAVKKRTKNRVIKMYRDGRIFSEPDISTTVDVLPKGTRIAMLGEAKDEFMKVEYKGEVYWVKAADTDRDDPFLKNIIGIFIK